MRTLSRLAFALAVLFAVAPARADDTKPPAISDVKPSVKGSSSSVEAKITDETGVLTATCFHRKGGSGKWEETGMVKNEYDDVFKVSFPGGADVQFYIQATDLLGNGPASFGSTGSPYGMNGRPVAAQVAVASKEKPKETPPPPKEEPKESPPPREASESHHAHQHTDKAPATPAKIAYAKPSSAPVEGQPFPVKFKVSSTTQVKNAGVFVRVAGTTKAAPVEAKSTGNDTWEATVPADQARGTVEYLIAVKNDAVAQAFQGDGDATTWFKVTFQSAAAPKQPLIVHHLAPSRVEPGKPIALRAQVSPPDIETLTDDKAEETVVKIFGVSAKVLFRGQDAADQVVDMTPDKTGGLGGFKAELPAASEGTIIYYQVIACDSSGEKCAIDTASKKKWHGLLVSSSDGPTPPPISAVSSKAPASLP